MDLTVIESGLVPVYQGESGQIVDARELHERLGSKRQFADWIKDRIQRYGFVENEDYFSLSQKCEGNNATRIDYFLTINTGKEIAMVENNEQGRKVRRYFIEVENKSRQPAPIQGLSPQLQLLINMELKQKELERTISETKEEIQGIRDVVALSPNSWREDTKELIVKMAQKLGGNEHIRDLRKESYGLLNVRMGVSLETRLTNKRRRMAEEGACRSKRDSLNALDVIADDKKLIEGYVAIVKDMAIKYGGYEKVEVSANESMD